MTWSALLDLFELLRPNRRRYSEYFANSRPGDILCKHFPGKSSSERSVKHKLIKNFASIYVAGRPKITHDDVRNVTASKSRSLFPSG